MKIRRIEQRKQIFTLSAGCSEIVIKFAKADIHCRPARSFVTRCTACPIFNGAMKFERRPVSPRHTNGISPPQLPLEGGRFGASCDLSGASWGLFGFGAIIGCLGAIIGCLGARIGCLGAIISCLGATWGQDRLSWGLLGASWGPLGSSWEPLGAEGSKCPFWSLVRAPS